MNHRRPTAQSSTPEKISRKFPAAAGQPGMKGIPNMKTTAKTTSRTTRPARLTTLALLATAAVLPACVSAPPAGPYNPQLARHLYEISHEAPVTPMPAEHGGWAHGAPYYGCGY
jgi:hypothetical protein